MFENMFEKALKQFITYRQTNSLTPCYGVCGFFLSVKFATSLLASLAGGQAVVVIHLHCWDQFIYTKSCK